MYRAPFDAQGRVFSQFSCALNNNTSLPGLHHAGYMEDDDWPAIPHAITWMPQRMLHTVQQWKETLPAVHILYMYLIDRLFLRHCCKSIRSNHSAQLTRHHNCPLESG